MPRETNLPKPHAEAIGCGLVEADVPGHFLHVKNAIEKALQSYIALNSQAATHPSFIGSEAFADQLYANLFTNSAIWSKLELNRFFHWISGQNSPCELAIVLAAMHALKERDYDRAARYARNALTILQNDLFVQKLYRRASKRGEGEPDLTGRFCQVPFETIETNPNGDVHFCCPAWLPVPIGNLRKSTHDQIWNSATAQEIRRSIHDGSFRYCSRTHCAKLSSNSLPFTDQIKPGWLRTISQMKSTRVESRPRKLILAHDRSCTLSCPSCRTKLIVAKRDEQNRLNAMADSVLLPLARDAERVRVTSSGDPFGSGHFRYVISKLTRADFPNLILDIQTNGVLFDETAWREMDLAGRVGMVAISLDAATEETYSIVRRGGSFQRLHENLQFLASRRVAGEIAFMRLDFVVQALNFAEMPDMPEIASLYSFDRIKFQMIRNWNTYDPAEFVTHDIGSEYNPRYREFLDVLRHPSLLSNRVEFWGMEAALEDAKRLERDHGPQPARRGKLQSQVLANVRTLSHRVWGR